MRGHSINEILASKPRPVRAIPRTIEIPLHPQPKPAKRAPVKLSPEDFKGRGTLRGKPR